jgi:hypothetical protein
VLQPTRRMRTSSSIDCDPPTTSASSYRDHQRNRVEWPIRNRATGAHLGWNATLVARSWIRDSQSVLDLESAEEVRSPELSQHFTPPVT